jgi:hypothetical protein
MKPGQEEESFRQRPELKKGRVFAQAQGLTKSINPHSNSFVDLSKFENKLS